MTTAMTTTRLLISDESHPLVAALMETGWRRILLQATDEETETDFDGSSIDSSSDDDDDSSSNVAGAVLSNIFLFFLIFGLSATVNVKNLKRQLTNKFAIGCGVLMQFLIMPALGWISVMTFREIGDNAFTKSMGIALLVVTSSPGGSYSNWWCSLFNADLALSVAMTTVSSVLSIALLPANLFLYTYLAYGLTGEDSSDDTEDSSSVVEALDFGTLFISLGVVLAAIATGLLAGYTNDSPQFHILANRFGSVCGLLLIVFSVFLSSGGDGSDAKFWNQDWSFYLAVALPCLLGLALANLISRSVHLSPPETVAIAIECCYQNTGIATSVAITMFDDPTERAQAVAVPLFYGVVEAAAIGVYCVLAWKAGWTKAPANEKFCVILGKTYEIEDSTEHAAGADDSERNFPAGSQEQAKDEKQQDGDKKDNKHDDGGDSDDQDPEGSLRMLEVDFAIAETPPAQSTPGRSSDHVSMSESGNRSNASMVVEQGFWGRIFPPVLQRVSSHLSHISHALSGSSSHHRDFEDEVSGADGGHGLSSVPANRRRAESSSHADEDSFFGDYNNDNSTPDLKPRRLMLPESGSNKDCASTPDCGGGVDANRNRFVSADYTAETSLCSHLSSPASPSENAGTRGGGGYQTSLRSRADSHGSSSGHPHGGSHAAASPVVFNIRTLTIPEVVLGGDNQSSSTNGGGDSHGEQQQQQPALSPSFRRQDDYYATATPRRTTPGGNNDNNHNDDDEDVNGEDDWAGEEYSV